MFAVSFPFICAEIDQHLLEIWYKYIEIIADFTLLRNSDRIRTKWRNVSDAYRSSRDAACRWSIYGVALYLMEHLLWIILQIMHQFSAIKWTSYLIPKPLCLNRIYVFRHKMAAITFIKLSLYLMSSKSECMSGIFLLRMIYVEWNTLLHIFLWGFKSLWK